MRTTLDLSDELFRQLKQRAISENLSLKTLIEKTAYEYLRKPMRSVQADEVVLPVIGDGSGRVFADPSLWWADVNERE